MMVLMAVSGLFYRGVVPSVPEIGAALIKLLSTSAFYWNLGVTAQEIAIGVAIGFLAGVHRKMDLEQNNYGECGSLLPASAGAASVQNRFPCSARR